MIEISGSENKEMLDEQQELEQEQVENLEEAETETETAAETETEVLDEIPEENPEQEEDSQTDTKDKEDKKLFKKKEKKPTKEEYDLLNDKYLRVCAEYNNFRNRSQKEKDSLYGDVRCNVILSFLPVYDNLERALNTQTEDEAYRKGVELIMKQFEDTFKKLGVEEIQALGEKFNPDFHNAVMHVDDETKGENEIVEVFQKGFKIGDKVIRFPMVKVAN